MLPSTIVFAPDSFKGSASADAVARALALGWSSVRPQDTLVLKPQADGGEGSLDAFEAAVPGARRMPIRVIGPHDGEIDAHWLLLPDGTGIVELANTSGLTLLSAPRALDAHTRGFGQAICAALDFGATSLLLAIGGSSSTDGGAGALTELGARFAEADGSPIAAGNRGLAGLASADSSSMRPPPEGGVYVLCDVTNPLLGARGAAAVFGPQKGAHSDALVSELESGLTRFARVITDSAGFAAPDSSTPDAPGAGAAGGAGFGLGAWGAQLVSGAERIAAVTGLDEAVVASGAVVTGEGSFDDQSARGKVVSRVLTAASLNHKPCLLVAGRIAAPTGDFALSISLTELAGSAERSLQAAPEWLREAGARLASEFEQRC